MRATRPPPNRAVVQFFADPRIARRRRVAPLLVESKAAVLEREAKVREQAPRFALLVRHERFIAEHMQRWPQFEHIGGDELMGGREVAHDVFARWAAFL